VFYPTPSFTISPSTISASLSSPLLDPNETDWSHESGPPPKPVALQTFGGNKVSRDNGETEIQPDVEIGRDSAPSAQSHGRNCLERVTQYLTPFNSAVVMGVGAFVTGYGVGLAEHQAHLGNYSGAQFVTGAAIGAVSLITALPVAIRCMAAEESECCPESACGKVAERTVYGLTTTGLLGIAGIIGYGFGQLTRMASDGRD
jgi:hypothetical protein